MKRFDLFGKTVAPVPADMADTVLVDPDTGYPTLVDEVTACNCSVNGTRRVCAMPGYCHPSRREIDRVIEILAGPSDEQLKRKPASEADGAESAMLAFGMVCIGTAIAGIAAMVYQVLMGAK